MARRHIHYEAAFEDYVRSRGWPYVPVDEQKRATFAGASIKSFDFIVYRPGKSAWLADVKGRKFPYVVKNGTRYWENWVTRGDVEGLRRWKAVFGVEFEPVFVFAYWLIGLESPELEAQTHHFRDRYYAFGWVSATEYALYARQRSPKWDTINVPLRAFRKMIRPVGEG